jgi:HAMP domain-containing protein
MTQPNLVLNQLFRRFLITTLLINSLGMMMSFIYLESLDAFPDGGTVLDYLPLPVLAAFTILLAAVLIFNIGWQQKRNREVAHWQQQLAAGADPTTVPPSVYRHVLNYAAASALLNLASWSAVAFVLAIIVALAAGAIRLFFITLLGLIGTSGLITSAGIYFGTELMWRPAISTFFPQGNIGRIPGVLRLSVLARLVLGFFLTAILPRIFLTNLTYRQAQQLLVAADPQSALVNWMNLELFFLVVTSAASIALAFLVTRGIVWPLRQMQTEMGRVQQNDFTTRTAVTTTDELGFLGERFNDMVAALERRNRELTTVYQISQDIATNLELDRTLTTILERVRQMIAYDAAEICLFDQESHELRGRAYYTTANGFRLEDGRTLFALGQPHAAHLIEKRESLTITTTPSTTSFTLAETTGRAFLAVPLLAGPKLIGSITLLGRQPFDQHDRQLLETIAPQAAIAIDNAAQIIEREKGLREEIRLLRIEIDETKRAQDVSQIRESDYFRQLQEEARRMRQQAEG